MYFDENTAIAIDVTNNVLKQFTVGSLARYYVRMSWYHSREQYVEIKRITLGQYTKGFWGYKNIVIPSLIVEDIDKKETFEVLRFAEGGWHKVIPSDRYSVYTYPEIHPFTTFGSGTYKTSSTVPSYHPDQDITFTVLSKLEAMTMLKDKVAKQEAAKEAAKQAELFAQQQQQELQRQNDAIKDEDITALFNKFKNNR